MILHRGNEGNCPDAPWSLPRCPWNLQFPHRVPLPFQEWSIQVWLVPVLFTRLWNHQKCTKVYWHSKFNSWSMKYCSSQKKICHNKENIDLCNNQSEFGWTQKKMQWPTGQGRLFHPTQLRLVLFSLGNCTMAPKSPPGYIKNLQRSF